MTGTTKGIYPPPPPVPVVATPSQPSAPTPPAPPVAEPPQPTAPQQPAEKTEEPQPIRPKAFKPGSGSKLPPNLDIDNQPVSGVRKPYQQQQPPMAQPINMAQVPPMANPPIKEQPVYQPFTPPTQQQPNTNGNFSTGLVWAILVLILCCNPIAIASIVLSAIAGGEFKRGDFENAQKHASLSKKITIIAVIISIISGVLFSMIPTDNISNDDDVLQQEEVENDSVKDKKLSETVEKIQENIKQNQSNNGVKLDIQPQSSGKLSKTVEKIQENIKQNQSNNDVNLDIQPQSSDNKEILSKEIIEELEKKKAEFKKKTEELNKSFEQNKIEFENTWEEQRKQRRSKQQSQN
ncbi:MAG: CD225/dispanin family protein [Victivallales bacterium]|nr:CD225/dispanin family protein [Victivallales bacterium]